MSGSKDGVYKHLCRRLSRVGRKIAATQDMLHPPRACMQEDGVTNEAHRNMAATRVGVQKDGSNLWKMMGQPMRYTGRWHQPKAGMQKEGSNPCQACRKMVGPPKWHTGRWQQPRAGIRKMHCSIPRQMCGKMTAIRGRHPRRKQQIQSRHALDGSILGQVCRKKAAT